MESKSVGQCQYFLDKKKRFCRFRPKDGASYCTEHICIMGLDNERKRIPCPLDPNHNCFEDQLEKHLKKCNVTKRQQDYQKQIYHRKGINKTDKYNEENESIQVAVRNLSSEKLQALVLKINALYEEHIKYIPTKELEHQCVKDVKSSESVKLDSLFGSQSFLAKELKQQASLVGQLQDLNLLNSNYCYVELGAGKGKLSHWVSKAFNGDEKGSYLLVDRSNVRYKMDAIQKREHTNITRLKIDIEDLCLSLVPEISEKKSVVLIGKHLCGGATDMGLRCGLNTLTEIKTNSDENLSTCDTLSEQKNQTVDEKTRLTCENVDADRLSFESLSCSKNDEPINKKAKFENCQTIKKKRIPKGVMIALCCHHRCTWNTYVGKEFFRSCGLDPEQFDFITRLSSWATCARVPVNKLNKEETVQGKDVETDSTQSHQATDLFTNEESKSYREQLSVTTREDIGRKCKALIDLGRVKYLQKNGMKCFVRKYISDSITPENIVLLATEENFL